jgi:hypothetical protein
MHESDHGGAERHPLSIETSGVSSTCSCRSWLHDRILDIGWKFGGENRGNPVTSTAPIVILLSAPMISTASSLG